jgi:hypothetical protein
MAELKPQVPISNLSTTIIGVSNFVPARDPGALPTYGCMSYTVAPSTDQPGDQGEGVPSQPLSTGAIRVVDSVLQARVPESAIRRE